jgi:hypothetical protein
MSSLAPLLQGFFTDRLTRQRQASPLFPATEGVRVPVGSRH